MLLDGAVRISHMLAIDIQTNVRGLDVVGTVVAVTLYIVSDCCSEYLGKSRKSYAEPNDDFGRHYVDVGRRHLFGFR